jgi:hypothetical protein
MSKTIARRAGILIALAVLLMPVFITTVQVVAAPVACSGPVIGFGRQRWCGYFKNIGFDNGNFVRAAGVPAGINTANEFINMVIGDINSGNAHRRTAAQFTILTMLGRGPGAPQSATVAQQNDWANRVRSYANVSENGNQSFGDNGRIDWFVSQHTPCNYMNTYYQVGQDDVAPYLDTPSNSNCEVASYRTNFIIFRDEAGNKLYEIRRICMNPMGTLRPLAEPDPPEFNLVPTITTSVGGAPITAGVEVGQTIRFSYSINNGGPDPSSTANCVIYRNTHPGYFPTPNPATGSGAAGPATSCPRTFPLGSTPVAPPEDVTVAAGNQTICRSLFVSPASQTVASLGDEECVPVVNKPYLKVYGGDISAGNGQPTAGGACLNNARAAIISWNRGGGANNYAGASTQFAALAMDAIYNVATSFGNGVGSAPRPGGLAFANTGANAERYGGSFGSLPCVADYFATRPGTTMNFTTLGAATTDGAYSLTGPGPFTISGALPAGARVVLYAEGDVYIDNNITYPANWTTADMPLFQLVVRGNIYIRNTVTQLAGIYIAQPNGGSGGTIYTCTTSAAPLAPSNTLHSSCNSTLTINGAFVAKDVRFLRTRGTLQQSTPGEANSSGNIAEIFNFSPALWMAQPTGVINGPLEYDSITALPPIL